jgi:hypothetical protein
MALNAKLGESQEKKIPPSVSVFGTGSPILRVHSAQADSVEVTSYPQEKANVAAAYPAWSVLTP